MGLGVPRNEQALGQPIQKSRRLKRPAKMFCNLRILLLYQFISDYQKHHKFLPDDMQVSVLLEEPADEFRWEEYRRRPLVFEGGFVFLWLQM